MKLGIITFKYEKKDLEEIKEMGLDFVEFCINSHENDLFNYQRFFDSVGQIKENLDEVNLFTGSIGRWGGYKIEKDGSINEKEFIADKTLIDAAEKLNCPIYVTSCNYVEELSMFENYKATIAYLEALIAYGKQKGIKILTNNCKWNNYIISNSSWSVIHGHLDDLGIKFDPSHLIYENEDYLSLLAKWGHRVEHIHLKGSLQVDGKFYDDPPAGIDQTDWRKFFAILYKLNYNKTLSIEPHSSTWQGDLGKKGILYTINYIKQFMF